jgi:NTE family protein
MSHALVLGGGGPVGIGWESGLVVGLAGADIPLVTADQIIGTSAGSVVGAQLALGLDIVETLTLAAAPLPVNVDAGAGAGMEALFGAIATSIAGRATHEETRVAVGRVALEAATVDEDTFVSRFSTVEGASWPASFRCTAVDTATGALKVWDAAAGVALPRAVASSCAVPGLFPPITLDGRRYMDGGMRTSLNVDLAAGADVVVAFSCMALSVPDSFSNPVTDAINAVQSAEIDRLIAGGSRLEIIAPSAEFLEISGWGLNLMDTTRVQAAFDAGRRQGDAEAARIGPFWSS